MLEDMINITQKNSSCESNFSFIDYSQEILVAIIYRFLIVLISFGILDSFTAVKHPKTAFNLSKFIEYSNIITQELETVKKSKHLREN